MPYLQYIGKAIINNAMLMNKLEVIVVNKSLKNSIETLFSANSNIIVETDAGI